MFRLYFRDSNAKVKSDKIYKSTKLGSIGNQLKALDKKPLFIEWELSEEYIVYTIAHKKNKQGAQRIGLVGDFKYKNGYLDDAVIYGAVVESIYKKKATNGSKRFYGQTYIPQNFGGVDWTNTYFSSSWMMAILNITKEEHLQADYITCWESNDCQALAANSYTSSIRTEGRKVPTIEIGGGYNEVQSWMGQNLFPDYWWDNPFKTNLI